MKNMIPKRNYNNRVVQKLIELKLTWLLNINPKIMCKKKIQIYNLYPKRAMPIKVLGVSSYNLGFWVFQCMFFLCS